VFIAGAVTLITMILVIPAAYAYARLEFPFKSVSLGAFLAVNMFTGAVLLIPLYRVLRTLGFLNTYWAMIIPGVAFLIPTGIWLLRSYLEKIPKELEEAAYVDGASRLYTLRRVVLPLAVPGLIVVSVAVFIGAYAQQFLFAITFNQVREYQPLPAGLFEFIGYQEVVWNQMMAAALIGVLPVLFIFLFLQKYLVAGLTAGAVKE
jgi:multiple sugar transport system permease protein